MQQSQASQVEGELASCAANETDSSGLEEEGGEEKIQVEEEEENQPGFRN